MGACRTDYSGFDAIIVTKFFRFIDCFVTEPNRSHVVVLDGALGQTLVASANNPLYL